MVQNSFYKNFSSLGFSKTKVKVKVKHRKRKFLKRKVILPFILAYNVIFGRMNYAVAAENQFVFKGTDFPPIEMLMANKNKSNQLSEVFNPNSMTMSGILKVQRGGDIFSKPASLSSILSGSARPILNSPIVLSKGPNFSLPGVNAFSNAPLVGPKGAFLKANNLMNIPALPTAPKPISLASSMGLRELIVMKSNINNGNIPNNLGNGNHLPVNRQKLGENTNTNIPKISTAQNPANMGQNRPKMANNGPKMKSLKRANKGLKRANNGPKRANNDQKFVKNPSNSEGPGGGPGKPNGGGPEKPDDFVNKLVDDSKPNVCINKEKLDDLSLEENRLKTKTPRKKEDSTKLEVEEKSVSSNNEESNPAEEKKTSQQKRHSPDPRDIKVGDLTIHYKQAEFKGYDHGVDFGAPPMLNKSGEPILNRKGNPIAAQTDENTLLYQKGVAELTKNGLKIEGEYRRGDTEGGLKKAIYFLDEKKSLCAIYDGAKKHFISAWRLMPEQVAMLKRSNNLR